MQRLTGFNQFRDTHQHASGQQVVEDVRTLLHQLHVVAGRVFVLAVGDWIHKPVHELLARSQQTGLDEVHHAVICKHSATYRI